MIAFTNAKQADKASATLPDCTPTLDTDPYADGDLLFDATELVGAVRENAGIGQINSIAIIDKDDQGEDFDLYFFSAEVDMGALNAAPSISDADAAYYLGHITVTDWQDLGGVQVAYVKPSDFAAIVKGAAGETSIYVGGVNGSGTPTHTASGIVIRVGIVQA